jgi:hypothetical protein
MADYEQQKRPSTLKYHKGRLYYFKLTDWIFSVAQNAMRARQLLGTGY